MPEVRGTTDFNGGAYPPCKNVPVVRPHDAHHFFVTDRRAGTDSSILRGVDTVAHHFHAVCGEGGAEYRGPRPTSSFSPQRELTPARLVIHPTDLYRHSVVLETLESPFEVRLAYFFPQQHYLRITASCTLPARATARLLLGRGPPLPCPPSFGLRTTPP